MSECSSLPVKELEICGNVLDYGMKHCDILKISDDEILFHTGMSNYDKAVEKYRANMKSP